MGISDVKVVGNNGIAAMITIPEVTSSGPTEFSLKDQEGVNGTIIGIINRTIICASVGSRTQKVVICHFPVKWKRKPARKSKGGPTVVVGVRPAMYRWLNKFSAATNISKFFDKARDTIPSTLT
jgi:hypothetical protein